MVLTVLSSILQWIIHQNGIQVVMHYLDDFLLVGALNFDECKHVLSVHTIKCVCILGPPCGRGLVGGPD